MNLAQIIKKEPMEKGWWLEIVSSQPCCTYYFGPFESAQQAILDQDGYIEDLVNEGAQGITVQIQWCKPKELTICPKDELAESFQM
ncbi:DUF1816 domain-containing protein [Scytonema sp. PCC 10023]|uniref:DUF1816 domain-containing protein n=1 Tax=Scytonema sp. PCC 10023 TaxID=1680591 RepID=UPI0039C613A6